MNLTKAQRLAESRIGEHLGLDWRFQWDNAVGSHGTCEHIKHVITLSRHVTRYVDEETVEDTIMHEIAHALAGPHAHHGPAWRKIAKSLGATPERTGPEGLGATMRKELAPWVGRCPNGHVSQYRYYRKPRLTRSCQICDPKFNHAYVMTYTREETA